MATKRIKKIVVPTPNTVYAKTFYTLLGKGIFSFSAEDVAVRITHKQDVLVVDDSDLYSQRDLLIINTLRDIIDNPPSFVLVGGEIELALLGTDGGDVILLSWKKAKIIGCWKGHDDSVRSLALAQNGNFALLGGNDMQVVLYGLGKVASWAT
jgi:hypothetical protein